SHSDAHAAQRSLPNRSCAANCFELRSTTTSCPLGMRDTQARTRGQGPMLKDGHYIACFKTELGQRTGRVLLKDGRIFGGDTVITYGGTSQVDGSQLTATLTTRRHAAGQPSVFGIDEVEIKFAGPRPATLLRAQASLSKEIPAMLFQVAWI